MSRDYGNCFLGGMAHAFPARAGIRDAAPEAEMTEASVLSSANSQTSKRSPEYAVAGVEGKALTLGPSSSVSMRCHCQVCM
jgi:hypothetical protein